LKVTWHSHSVALRHARVIECTFDHHFRPLMGFHLKPISSR